MNSMHAFMVFTSAKETHSVKTRKKSNNNLNFNWNANVVLKIICQ